MKKSRIKRIMLSIVFIIVIAIAISIVISKSGLIVSNYSIGTPDSSSDIRCVLLTDLHNSEFGKNNSRLVKKIEKLTPDLICMAGDMINGDEETTSKITQLISELKEIAPIYYSYGNHEKEYERIFGTDLKGILENAGANVLEYDWEDIEVNGQEFRIGGIYGYCLPPEYVHAGNPEEQKFITEFQETNRYKILLCHMPVCWIKNHGLDGWDVDLVLAGHNHGGQIILPYWGGAYAPDMGKFAGRVWGEFTGTETGNKLIISRGLGSEMWIPRMNNIPEIVSIDISTANPNMN